MNQCQCCHEPENWKYFIYEMCNFFLLYWLYFIFEIVIIFKWKHSTEYLISLKVLEIFEENIIFYLKNLTFISFLHWIMQYYIDDREVNSGRVWLCPWNNAVKVFLWLNINNYPLFGLHIRVSYVIKYLYS